MIARSPPAQRTVLRELLGVHRGGVERALHVLELSHVVVASGHRGGRPAEEEVGKGLHEALAFHHPFALVQLQIRRRPVVEHRCSGLLQLKEQWILQVAAEQADPAMRADTADPDDFPRDVNETVAAEEDAPFGGERSQVAGHEAADLREDGRFVVQSHHQWRIVTYAPRVARHLGELIERLQMASLLCFGCAGSRVSTNLAHQTKDVVNVDAGVPDIEGGHACECRDVLSIRARGIDRGSFCFTSAETDVARRDDQARSEAFEVPLPRTAKGLVEVIDAEYQATLRRCIETEIAQVRIPTELDLDATHRGQCEIARHDRSGTPKERERGRNHALEPDGDEVG